MQQRPKFLAIDEASKTELPETDSRKGHRASKKESRRDVELRCSLPPLDPKGRLPTKFIVFKHLPSATSFRDLEPIRLSELRLEIHHVGRVLIVKTFTEARRFVGVQAGIQDELGDVDVLAVYHTNPKLEAAKMLPEGTVIAIKEPYYKVSAAGGCVVRVDHPSDLVQLALTDEIVPAALLPRLLELDTSAEQLKLEGNKAYKAEDYLSALKSYTQGIAACGKDDVDLELDLLRNRSIVNIYLQRYEAAVDDASASVIPKDFPSSAVVKNDAKAHFRAGRALYLQEEFVQAKQRFEWLLELLTNDADSARELKRTESRLKEQDEGEYDFAAISRSVDRDHMENDHASYTAKVEVKELGEKGQGLVSTTDIKAGDLVMCEKAFLVSVDADSGAEDYLAVDPKTNRGTVWNQTNLMSNLTQKMLHHPKAAQRYFALYDGGYEPKRAPTEVDGVTTVDVFHAFRIKKLNVFECPPVRSTAALVTPGTPGRPGIWITASRINHACDGNAARSFLGNLLILRATKDIAKGAEITMPYRPANPDNMEMQMALSNDWNFMCTCDVCLAEVMISAGHRGRRKQLIKEVHDLSADTQKRRSATSRPEKNLINKCQKLYDQLEATYDESLFANLPRLGLVDLGTWMLTMQAPTAQKTVIVDQAMRVLRDCGFVASLQGSTIKVDHTHCYLHPYAIDATACAARVCFRRGDESLGKQFEALAKKLWVIRFGALEGFKERYVTRA